MINTVSMSETAKKLRLIDSFNGLSEKDKDLVLQFSESLLKPQKPPAARRRAKKVTALVRKSRGGSA
jgi:hypothetical protein